MKAKKKKKKEEGQWHMALKREREKKDASCVTLLLPYWLPYISLSNQAKSEGRELQKKCH